MYGNFVILYRLNVSIGETAETLEMAKANIDDQYKLNQMRIQEYQNITAEYEETWNTYRVSKSRYNLRYNRLKLKNIKKLFYKSPSVFFFFLID